MFRKIMQRHRKQKNCSNLERENTSQDEILPFVMTFLTPALIDQAKSELNETDDVRIKSLEELRRLIHLERKLETPTDDIFLLAFLRTRKFNVEKAFKLLQNFWTLRKDYGYIYNIIDIPSVITVIMRNVMGFLHFRDRNGCVVLIAKLGTWDPAIDAFEDVARTLTAWLIFAAEFPATQIAGFRVIVDLRKISWIQLKHWTPSTIIYLIRGTQFSFPGRFKGVHIVANSKVFNFVWGVMYPFLPSKLKERIFVHGENMEPLKQYIHPSVLPQEFGGEAPEFDNSKWAETLENIMNRIAGMANYGYKE